LFVWCPFAFILEKAGLLEFEDLANYKYPEKTYYFDESEKRVKSAAYGTADEKNIGGDIPFFASFYMNSLNGIEEGKASVETVYTNYLPFYAELLSFMNSANDNIQGEFVFMLKSRSKPEILTGTETIKTAENTENTENTDIPAEPEPPPINFIASKISDAGMFRVYRVRSEDNSIKFLDISMAMPHSTGAENMLAEQKHINRIAAANSGVNFFVYIASRMQDMDYYNEIVPSEPSTYDIFRDFIDGISGDVAGIAWFDIDTFEKRMERCYKTDHHWNALGAYQAYTEVIGMIKKAVPEIGEPLPLKGLIEFPDVEFCGSGAARTRTSGYYDSFAVMDIDLPAQHPTERVRSKLDEYKSGRWDVGRVGKNDYTAHYENFYDTPEIITYPENNTGRKLLILGDSYAYWVSWLIGANFDKTFVHYTLWEKNLDYNKFIRDNGITDVLLLQYSARTLSKATSASKYLEQIITN
jgi:hypothetical protein